ncbi:MFS transporter, partial [Paraburkholderia sp. BR14262]
MTYATPAPASGASPRESDAIAGGTVDIGRTLDEGAYSTLQKFAVVLAALSIVVDGFDSQLIGFAIPVLIKEWGITRNAFAPVVAAGLIGMG